MDYYLGIHAECPHAMHTFLRHSPKSQLRLSSVCMIGFALLNRRKTSVQHRLAWVLLAVGLTSLLGCRQRAITEMYVEQMAQRNRALEDLVYDFDAENRAMEFEIEDLRRTNAQLQGRLQELQRQSVRVETSPSDRKLPLGRTESEPKAKGPASAPLKLPQSRGTPEDASRGNPPTEEPLKLEPPEVVLPKKLPEAEVVQPSQPVVPGEPLLPSPEPLRKPPVSPKEPSSELLPEIAPPSAPSATKESLLKQAPSGLPGSDTDGTGSERKIQLPAIPLPTTNASGKKPTASSPSGVVQTSATEIKSKPIDPRVRQIDWHPTMCRAQNTDGKPGDDGLYLVLVPRNSAGEFVPTTGSLTIVVEETLPDNQVVRIGRYEYTPKELNEQLEPIGTAPGLHLPIRWAEQTPSGSSVEVYAKFTLEDGTTMVNRRTIPLRRLANSGPSNWTPR